MNSKPSLEEIFGEQPQAVNRPSLENIFGTPGFIGGVNTSQPQQPTDLGFSDRKQPTSIARTALDYGLRGSTFGIGNKVSNALAALGAGAYLGENPIDLYHEANKMQQNRMDQELQQNPKTAIGSELGGGLLGGLAALGTAPGAALANTLSSGNLLARIAKSTLAGGISGGIYGGTTAPEGKTLESIGQGATTGATLGGALPLIAAPLNAAKNAIIPKIDPIIQNLAQKAIDYGIPLSRTQIGDSAAAKTIASATGKLPGTGAASFQKEQQSAFNKHVLDTIGVNANKVTPDIIADAYKNISKKFDNALKGQNITISNDVLDQIAQVETQAKNDLIPDNFGIVRNQINKIFSSLGEDGTIPGEKIGNLRSEFSELSRGKGGEKPFIRRLKDIVQNASVEGAPSRKADLEDAIQKFRNYQIIKPLLNKATRGDIPASQLLGRVASNYPDFARGGGGKLGDLARIGQAFLKDPIPDSGTAQRTLVYKALGALGAGGWAGGIPGALGAVGTPIALGRIFNTINTAQPLVEKAISNKVARNPSVIPYLSSLLPATINNKNKSQE